MNEGNIKREMLRQIKKDIAAEKAAKEVVNGSTHQEIELSKGKSKQVYWLMQNAKALANQIESVVQKLGTSLSAHNFDVTATIEGAHTSKLTILNSFLGLDDEASAIELEIDADRDVLFRDPHPKTKSQVIDLKNGIYLTVYIHGANKPLQAIEIGIMSFKEKKHTTIRLDPEDILHYDHLHQLARSYILKPGETLLLQAQDDDSPKESTFIGWEENKDEYNFTHRDYTKPIIEVDGQRRTVSIQELSLPDPKQEETRILELLKSKVKLTNAQLL